MTVPTPRRRRARTRPDDLLDAARSLQPRTVALRRAIHRRPEEGLHTPLTHAAVLEALEDLPLRLHLGRSTASVVGVLDGDRPGPTVLLRADMDALPLTESSGVSFRSEFEGVMHACGHDTHVAMLASAARLVAERRGELAGRVVLAFQPGEEGYHGARHMIDEGLLEIAGEPQRALAVHITSTLDAGVVQSRPGPIMASSDLLRICVRGRGGHASSPQDALDPVPVAAAIIGHLQTMVTRTVSVFDPAVLTIGQLRAGVTSNIIPETAELTGTIRALSQRTRERVHAEVRRVAENVAAAHGCTADIGIEIGYPVAVNDEIVGPAVVDLAKKVLGEQYGEPMPDPLMGAEDFSYVLQRVPGALAFLGACPAGSHPETAAPNHSNRVVFDEPAMIHGVALYTAFALDALGAPVISAGIVG